MTPIISVVVITAKGCSMTHEARWTFRSLQVETFDVDEPACQPVQQRRRRSDRKVNTTQSVDVWRPLFICFHTNQMNKNIETQWSWSKIEFPHLVPLSIINLLCKYADDVTLPSPRHTDILLDSTFIYLRRYGGSIYLI